MIDDMEKIIETGSQEEIREKKRILCEVMALAISSRHPLSSKDLFIPYPHIYDISAC